MTKRTNADLKTQITTLWPDNTNEEISPADVRSVADDIVDSKLHADTDTDGIAEGTSNKYLTAANLNSVITLAGSLSGSVSGNVLTITGTDTNTQLTNEQVQDIVGAMLRVSGPGRGDYDDTAGTYTITINTQSGGGGGGSLDKDGLLALIDNTVGNVDASTSSADATKISLTATGTGNPIWNIILSEVQSTALTSQQAPLFIDTGVAEPDWVGNASYLIYYAQHDSAGNVLESTRITNVVRGNQIRDGLKVKSTTDRPSSTGANQDFFIQDPSNTSRFIAKSAASGGNILFNNGGSTARFEFRIYKAANSAGLASTIDSFIELDDTPDSLGTALQQLRINAAGTALEWFTPTSGGTPSGQPGNHEQYYWGHQDTVPDGTWETTDAQDSQDVRTSGTTFTITITGIVDQDYYYFLAPSDRLPTRIIDGIGADRTTGTFQTVVLTDLIGTTDFTAYYSRNISGQTLPLSLTITTA